MLQQKGDRASIVFVTAVLHKQQQTQRKMEKWEDDGLLLAGAPNLGSLTRDSKCDSWNTWNFRVLETLFWMSSWNTLHNHLPQTWSDLILRQFKNQIEDISHLKRVRLGRSFTDKKSLALLLPVKFWITEAGTTEGGKNPLQLLWLRGEVCPWKSEGKSEESLLWGFLSPGQWVQSNTGCLCRKKILRAGSRKKITTYGSICSKKSMKNKNSLLEKKH